MQSTWVLVLSAPGHHSWSHTYFRDDLCWFLFLFIRTGRDAGCVVLSVLLIVSWQEHLLWAFCASISSVTTYRSCDPLPPPIYELWSFLSSYLKPLASLPTCNLFPFPVPKAVNNSVCTLVLRISDTNTCPSIWAFLRQKVIYFLPCSKSGRSFLKSFSSYFSESLSEPGITYLARLTNQGAQRICLSPPLQF